MASSLSRSAALFILSTLLAISILTPSCVGRNTQITDAVVDQICNETEIQSYCHHLIKSVPNVTTIDLLSLEKILVHSASTKSAKTAKFIGSLVSNTTDQVLKKRYGECSAKYEAVVMNLKQAEAYLSSGNFLNLSIAAFNSHNGAVECGNVLSAPPVDPSALPRKNRAISYMTLIIGYATNLLRGN